MGWAALKGSGKTWDTTTTEGVGSVVGWLGVTESAYAHPSIRFRTEPRKTHPWDVTNEYYAKSNERYTILLNRLPEARMLL